jgi:3-deoxy-D-manno-octulosonic-acid transferase
MTVITPGGREVADTLIGKEISATAYLPFDLASLAWRAVTHIRPTLFVGIETEIWPNLLWALLRFGARAALVNARLSDKSLPRYRRVRRLIGWALSAYDRVLSQSDEDARRFIELGAPVDRTSALGNVKFDEADRPLSADEVAAWRRQLCLSDDARVWIAGSTRVLAEERLVWQAHQAVLRSIPDAVLIHAPRHVDRADEVERGMREAGLEPVRRSRLSAGSCAPRTIILDTFGELGKVYAVADIAFIGNSIVPPGGGQNLLQPLAQGKGVLFGPYMNNFRDAVTLAVQAGVGFAVEDPQDLATRVTRALTDESWRTAIAQQALDLVERNRGASRRYAEALKALLDDAGGREPTVTGRHA